jgi:hypothetical protein
MKLKFALLLCSALAIAVAAASEKRPVSCHDAIGGQTYQEHVDALFDRFSRDDHGTLGQRLESIGAKAEFDSLCTLDDELGSHEADAFMNEEGARQTRIAAAFGAQTR